MEGPVSEMDHMDVPAGEDASARATPVMSQFLVLKQANPGSLLFFRMGDFYELFFQDAEIASQALGITLTKRGKHLGEDIPMCGVPVHAADAYLQKLIRTGHRVAVCEQMEDPAEARKRGSKSVVKRDVVRLVTPGTLTEDNLLDSRSYNFLVSVARSKSTGDLAIAWACTEEAPAAGAATPFSAAITAATSARACAQPEAPVTMLALTGMAQASALASCALEAIALTCAPWRAAWRTRCANSGWSLRKLEPTTSTRCSVDSEAMLVPSHCTPCAAANSARRKRASTLSEPRPRSRLPAR